MIETTEHQLQGAEVSVHLSSRPLGGTTQLDKFNWRM